MAEQNTQVVLQDDSPQGLAPSKPQAKRLSAKLKAVLALSSVVLIMILVFSIFSSSPTSAPQQASKQPTASTVTNSPLLKVAPSGGLAIPEPQIPAEPALAQRPAPQVPMSANQVPTISPQVQAWQQQREQIRQMRRQLELQALQSPLTTSVSTSKSNSGAAPNASGQFPSFQSAMPDLKNLTEQPTQQYDATERKDKENFLGTRSKADNQWQLAQSRTAGAKYELKTGAVIPGLMLTGVNSDLPGQVIGQVSRNVYDSATGHFLLIPQGSRLLGQYDSRVAMGQQRVLIAWQRIIFPDGSALTLESMPGADQAGNAGLHDDVDNHYFRIFGTAALMSMITGGMSWSVDALSGAENSSNEKKTLQDEMGTALASQMGQASMQLLQQNATIKPTLEIRSGSRFNVVLVKDLVFERPYTPETL